MAEYGMGHNNPPSHFDEIKARIDDLYEESLLWADGQPVANDAIADDLANLINLLRTAIKNADALRKEMVAPFDKGKAEVQAQFNPLIADNKGEKGKAVVALNACSSLLQVYLSEKERRRREAEESKRREAEEARRQANAAVIFADNTNLAEVAATEAIIKEAQQLQLEADCLGKASTNAGSMGRAVGLRKMRVGTINNIALVLQHYMVQRLPDLMEALQPMVNEDVRAHRPVPGVIIRIEERVQ